MGSEGGALKSLSDIHSYNKIYVDAMNLCYSSFNGMKNWEDTSGRKTGMLYGVVRFFLSCKTKYRNAEVRYLWEGMNSWRREKYSYYKAKRSKSSRAKDDDFMDSIADVKYALTLMGVHQDSWYTMEADDLAAHYVFDMTVADRVMLVTKDQDWYALSEPYVDILSGKELLTREAIDRHLGYPAERITLYKMLTGDSSDEVPGVPRFPHKLAIRLCNEIPVDDYERMPYVLRSWGEEVWAEKLQRAWNRVEANYDIVMPHATDHAIETVQGAYDKIALVEFLSSRSMEKSVSKILSWE